VQVKLLRVLQEREFERVGGTRPVSVDVRVISATNRDLRVEMAEGRFREDLFYRLNVFPVVLPPLAERRDAIVSLAQYFAGKYGRSLGKEITGFTPSAIGILQTYAWPGNVRELQNVIERAAILSNGKIDAVHLNLERPKPDSGRDEGLLRTSEQETIRRVLAEVQGNRSKASKLLGISLRTLQYRIKEYRL
jgi:transcriptional regulator with PAS, ATPase and Fis domain